MKLLVVIVSYRVTDLTVDCLRSLKSEIARHPGIRVAVCENGTGGDAEDRLRDAIVENGWDSWVDLTAIYPNRGFTGGNNAVIRPALQSVDPPKYVLLLNADTIVQEHAIDTMVDFMDSHPKAGIAGSLLLSREGEPQASPFRLPGIATELDRGMRMRIVSRLLSPWGSMLPKQDKPIRAGWVCGASMILRREMLDQIGLLDEGLFTYFDDPDLCLRATRAGWEIWFVPESRVVHLEGATTGVATRLVSSRLPAYWHQARRRFFLKNYGACYTALTDTAFIVGYATCRLRRWLLRTPDTDPPHMLIDSIRHSVFCAGVRVPVVQNPAMRETAANSATTRP